MKLPFLEFVPRTYLNVEVALHNSFAFYLGYNCKDLHVTLKPTVHTIHVRCGTNWHKLHNFDFGSKLPWTQARLKSGNATKFEIDFRSKFLMGHAFATRATQL